VLLPYAQEATDLPSDTGSDRTVIEQKFGKLVDATLVEEGWVRDRRRNVERHMRHSTYLDPLSYRTVTQASMPLHLKR
jgi:hypothetical protein